MLKLTRGVVPIPPSQRIPHNHHLNPSQKAGVEAMHNNDQLITIIHGPPGTGTPSPSLARASQNSCLGKTSTLIAALRHCYQTDQRVLITAPSNNAVSVVRSPPQTTKQTMLQAFVFFPNELIGLFKIASRFMKLVPKEEITLTGVARAIDLSGDLNTIYLDSKVAMLKAYLEKIISLYVLLSPFNLLQDLRGGLHPHLILVLSPLAPPHPLMSRRPLRLTTSNLSLFRINEWLGKGDLVVIYTTLQELREEKKNIPIPYEYQENFEFDLEYPVTVITEAYIKCVEGDFSMFTLSITSSVSLDSPPNHPLFLLHEHVKPNFLV